MGCCHPAWDGKREIELKNYLIITFLFFYRKGALLVNNIFMAIAAVFLFAAKYANSFEMLILGRLLIGINSGINAGVSPMYLTEITPTALRGAVGTVYQLIITISILLSQILGMENVLGNEQGWPFLLGNIHFLMYLFK